MDGLARRIGFLACRRAIGIKNFGAAGVAIGWIIADGDYRKVLLVGCYRPKTPKTAAYGNPPDRIAKWGKFYLVYRYYKILVIEIFNHCLSFATRVAFSTRPSYF